VIDRNLVETPVRRRRIHRAARIAGLAALLAAAPALAQWSTESPKPTHLEARGIAAVSPQHLFLATDDDSFDDGGALFESTDGGATWIQRDVPASLASGLFGIQFLDAQLGWVWGNENYRTSDGGATWEALPFLGSTYLMKFHTAAFGVATGNFGAYVSRDGGLTWEPSPEGMSRFTFADAATALGAAATGVQRSSDGGQTFVPVLAGEAADVAFLSAGVAVAIVDDGLHRSTDGGLTWTLRAEALGRSDLFALSEAVVFAWGRSGAFPDYDDRLLRSADGGDTWSDLGEVIDPGPFGAAPALAAPGGATVVASDGAGRLFRSLDAGLTWDLVFTSPGPTVSFFSSAAPDFADEQTGYFAFGDGYVIRSGDGGATWEQVSSGSGAGVLALDRFASGDLVAVGEGGRVLTRTSGSPRWRIRATLGTADLVALQVIGALEALAVDATGLVHRTVDGGLTWTAFATAPPTLTATGLHFTTALAGWVVGQGFDGAALFRTADGGATWTPVTDFQGSYVAVDFVGPAGWAAGMQGALWRTTDGGATWTEHALPGFPASIHDLDFWSASIGYAVGDGGYAARSADGGLTWQLLPTPDSGATITDLALTGPDELWASTATGGLLYSATGGDDWAAMDSGPVGFGAIAAVVATPEGNAWIGGWRGLVRRFAGPPPPPVNQPPIASYDYLTTGLSVALTDTSVDNDGTIVAWSWDFGDGTTSTEQHPVHVFPAAGTFHVQLTVTDDDGATDAALRFLVVQPGPGGTFGDFTEVTPLDPLWVTPQDEDFWVAATASADYDADGDLDLVVFGYYVIYNESVVDRLVLLRNEGPATATAWDFSYVELPTGTLTAGASDLAWGDFDGDGDQDLVVGSDGETAIYRNDAGDLVPTSIALPGYHEINDQADFDLRSISWADFDNDGDLDLLVPSVWDPDTFSTRTALLRNDGDDGAGGWTFTEIETDFGPSEHVQSAWADFDDDLDVDLLLVHLAPLTGEGFVRRYRNDGGGVFVGEEILGALAVEHGEAQWGDSDDDGDLDVLVAGNVREPDGTFATVLRLYRNDAETFVPVELIDCVSCEGWFDLTAATWADYDSDGDIDILLAGTYNSGSQIEGRAKVYDNEGGVFVDSGNQLPAPRAMGFSGGAFTWLDIDAEGDLDYFVAGPYFVPGGNGLVETQMHLYLNDAPGANSAPTAPTAPFSQVFPDGSVTLGWTPASDDHTPAQSLTYDLKLYLDGVPLPAARRNPEPGSLSAVDEWTLAALPDGVYRWTVEAVDSALNSGPAAQSTFVVGTPPAPLFADGFESGNASAWSAVVP
jgi:photosystem II stability/assembly factor-like uncharacterized protein